MDTVLVSDGTFVMKKSLKRVLGLCFILVGLTASVYADERIKALVANLRPPNLFISKSDLALKPPSINWKDANYSIQIKRQYKGATEAKMLARAESVYPAASTILAAIKAKTAVSSRRFQRFE
jgi:hypothetical protein